jgi:methionyl-tRNA formyltransferase
VVFSGPGGAIVRAPLFATGKRFIHVHPGRLPEFRGSTTIYYGLLAEGRIEATALLLSEQIDAGPIIGRAMFDPPRDRTTIDATFDPNIRAALLVSVLREYARHGSFQETAQERGAGETFYIIHPVLKHLAILAQ